MRVLRHAAGLLARLVADLLLVLAALTILLWIATRTRPLSVGHRSASREEHWDVSLRIAAAHGGLWFLHLSTRPPDMPVPLGLGAPYVWSVQATDAYDPDARLTAMQSGPRRFGFSTALRQAPDRTYAGVDPRTGGRAHYVFREQERITRVPFAAIAGALLILPAVRITLALRRRFAHRHDPSAAPYPTFPVLRRCTDLAALAATLPLAFAVYQWVASRHDTNALSWSTQPLPSPLSASGVQVRRAIEWSPQGWQFSRTSFVPVGRVTYPAPATAYTHTIGLNVRDDLSGRAPPPSYLTVGATSGSVRHLGFAYEWHDTPMGIPTYYAPPPQVQRSPSGVLTVTRPGPVLIPPAQATSRRTGASLLIPHWAVVVILAIPPALGALRFRAPLRRSRRLRRGLCPDCGYDLRSTPDRCPECGRPTMNRERGAPSNPV